MAHNIGDTVTTSTWIRIGALAVTAAASPGPAAQAPAQRDPSRLAAVKQWTAEVILTSDCDRFDGSRVVIHNRVVTTYDLTRRATDAPGLKWRGRASTTYKWSVGLGVGFNGLDVEESSDSFDTDAELDLTDTVKLSAAPVPPRPFTRKKLVGDQVTESVTADDEPPVAELTGAALPDDDDTLRGNRAESGYVLLGGVVLTCPGRRQWTLHPGTPLPKP